MEIIKSETLQNFLLIFISIILEAMPFIMLGALVSALIQVFVSEDTIAKVIPKNKLIALAAASVMGLIFPVCECAIIPITRRLIKKGVPLGIGITFMLSVPIVNPVVMASTYYAFYNMPKMVLIRSISGIIIAILAGYFVEVTWGKKESPLTEGQHTFDQQCSCGCSSYEYVKGQSKLSVILGHTSKELQGISKYLILGAAISSAFQSFIPKKEIVYFGQGALSSVIIMLILAFALSLCSEADAFIARTFVSQFTLGSVAAFLIFGPMLDIKNTLMLTGSFKSGVSLRIIGYVTALALLAGTVINMLLRFGVI